MKYCIAEMKIITANADILTLSDAGINRETDWGSLDFGGAKNTPLSDLANSLAEKL